MEAVKSMATWHSGGGAGELPTSPGPGAAVPAQRGTTAQPRPPRGMLLTVKWIWQPPMM